MVSATATEFMNAVPNRRTLLGSIATSLATFHPFML